MDYAAYSVWVTNSLTAVLSETAKLTLPLSPTITAPGLNAGMFTVRFATEQGPTYVVEYKSSLDDPAWQELTELAGTGSPVTISDNGLTNGMRFYRIHVK